MLVAAQVLSVFVVGLSASPITEGGLARWQVSKPLTPATSSKSVVDLRFTGLDGRPVNLRAIKRPMVLNLWAAWCLPCNKQIDLTNDLQKQFPLISFLGVSVDGKRQAVAKAAKDFGFRYKVVLGQFAAIREALGEPMTLPTYILVDAQGTSREVLVGVQPSRTEWQEKLSRLVKSAR